MCAGHDGLGPSFLFLPLSAAPLMELKVIGRLSSARFGHFSGSINSCDRTFKQGFSGNWRRVAGELPQIFRVRKVFGSKVTPLGNYRRSSGGACNETELYFSQLEKLGLDACLTLSLESVVSFAFHIIDE